MKYRFYGDTLQLVRYELEVKHTETVLGEDGETEEKEYTDTMSAVTDSERDALLERYPDATVTEVDNTGYEWLDGLTFTQEQLRNGELEQAIAMGQEAYEAMKTATDQSAINAWFLLKIAELTAELAEVKGNE